MFGQYTCLGSQCPPQNEFNIVPQFYPPLPEQTKNAPQGGDQMETWSRQTNAQIRQKLQQQIASMRGTAIQSELQAIFNALMEVYNWVLQVKPPYPEAAAFRAHKQAEKKIEEAMANAPVTPQVEQEIIRETIPPPKPQASFIRRNAIPLFVGGGVLILGVIGMLLLIKV